MMCKLSHLEGQFQIGYYKRADTAHFYGAPLFHDFIPALQKVVPLPYFRSCCHNFPDILDRTPDYPSGG